MKLIMSDRPLSIPAENQNNTIRFIDLSALKIAGCTGCFGCWTKTPGRCVIRDDAARVYPLIAESEAVLYVSRIRYGGYDTCMKTMLERAIPVQQAFIRIHEGETHHVQRAVAPKQAVILAYGDISEESRAIFERLVERNAKNMSFVSWMIRFVEEAELESAVLSEVEQWENA